MIIATAGHIDHGKTTLVRALTGVDTDRLPEEKQRGISIDLGFAYWRTPSGATIGFVDVPGHERFVGNMLAGVCGIDYVMLVVAADDGVMPQTREHLAIVDLLGVDRGIAVLTKADRAPAERVEEVRAEVRALLAPTRLAGIPVLAASAVTGAGMDELRTALLGAVASARGDARQRMLRYAVDRAFTVAGSGTVVTGTLFAGTVRTGDRVVVSPAGAEARVRGLQKDGKAADEAAAGERCALNLAGVEVERAGRGNWIVAPAAHAPTQRIDARVRVLASEPRPLRHWTPVRLHLGTAHCNARIGIARGGAIAPGGSGLAQLVLEAPLAAVHGERFILRDGAANRTLGGGTVLDPAASPFRRNPAARAARLAALEQDSPRAALDALLACSPGGVDLAWFGRAFNLGAERARALAAECGATALGRDRPVLVAQAALHEFDQRIVGAVRVYHARAPESEGIAIDALRREAAPSLPADAFADLLRGAAQRLRLVVAGSIVRQAAHSAQQNAGQQRVWSALQPVLEEAGYQVPRVKEIAERTGLAESALRDVLHARAKTGEVVRVSEDRFYPQATLSGLAAIAVEAAGGGEFTVAQYRDRSGVGRNLAIEILECFDRLGITRRVGLARRIRKDYAAVLGTAAPAGRATGASA